MEKIKGLIDAPFTPFYPDGEVNYEPIPAYAAMLKKNGLKGVFINGSSGEGYMLTDDERTCMLFFNRDLIEENQLEDPYQLVRDDNSPATLLKSAPGASVPWLPPSRKSAAWRSW